MMLATLSSACGLLLFKRQAEDGRPWYANPSFWGGFLLLVVNASVLDLLAFAVTPLSIIAPFAGDGPPLPPATTTATTATTAITITSTSTSTSSITSITPSSTSTSTSTTSGLTIVFSVLLVYVGCCGVREAPRGSTLAAVGVIVVGVTLAACFGPHSNRGVTPADMARLMATRAAVRLRRHVTHI